MNAKRDLKAFEEALGQLLLQHGIIACVQDEADADAKEGLTREWAADRAEIGERVEANRVDGRLPGSAEYDSLVNARGGSHLMLAIERILYSALAGLWRERMDILRGDK